MTGQFLADSPSEIVALDRWAASYRGHNARRVTFDDDASSSIFGVAASRDVLAAAIAESEECRHEIIVEHGVQCKKLALPAAARAVLGQRFEARAGDTLEYEFVVLLSSGAGCGIGRSAACAVLHNLAEGTVELMLNRVAHSQSGRPQRIASNCRERVAVKIPADGVYDLRFVTSVDPASPGSESHFLVDAVRIRDSAGGEATRLASICSIGRVRPMSIRDSND